MKQSGYEINNKEQRSEQALHSFALSSPLVQHLTLSLFYFPFPPTWNDASDRNDDNKHTTKGKTKAPHQSM